MDFVSGISRRLSRVAVRRTAVLLLLALPLLLLFYPVLFGDRVMLPLDQLNTMTLPYSESHAGPSVQNHYLLDAVTQFYPAKVALQRHWRAGEPAFWNQEIFGGYPQYAQTMGAPFNITNPVLLLCDLPGAWHWQILLQLYIAGLAMYILLRMLPVGSPVAIICSIAWMLNSLFITSLLLPVVVGAFCWAPLVIAGLLRYRRRRDRASLLLTSAALAAGFLGGSLQTSAALVVMLLIFHMAIVFRSGERSGVVRSFLPLIVIVLVAAALSAVMWLPSLELAWLDMRRPGSKFTGKLEPYGILDRILSIPLLLSFFMPELAGSVRSFDFTKFVGSSMEDFTGFAGFAPLLFATLGAPLLWKRDQRSRPFILLALAGLLLPIATPLYSFLYHRFFIVFLLGAVVVAALSIQRFLDDPDFAQRLARLARRALVVVVLLFAGIVLLDLAITLFHDDIHRMLAQQVVREIASSRSAAGNVAWMYGRVERLLEHFSILSPTVWLPLLCMAIVIGVVLLYRRLPVRSRLTLLLPIVAVTLLQLVVFARSWLPFSDPGLYPLYPAAPVIDRIADERDRQPPFRVLPVNIPPEGEMILQPNILSLYGIPTLGGYENVMPMTLSSLATLEPDARLLGQLNVRYLVARRDRLFSDSAFVRLDGDTGQVSLYRNDRWRPRAYMAYRHRVEADSDAVRTIRDDEFDGSTVILASKPPELPRTDDTTSSVVVREATDNRLVIDATTGSAGYLVIADTWYPGWKASVGGREAPILRANVVMRAIALPKGSSRVELRFEPEVFRVGAWVSGVVALLCVALGRGTRMNTDGDG